MFSMEYREYVVLEALEELGDQNFYSDEVIAAMLESSTDFEGVMGTEVTAPCEPLRQLHQQARELFGEQL